MAKLLKPFQCVPAGAIHPVTFKPGEDCPKEHEESARALGCFDEGASVQGVKDEASRILDEIKAEYEKRLAAAAEDLAKMTVDRNQWRHAAMDAGERITALETQLSAATKSAAKKTGAAAVAGENAA